jgi:uncharacterized protein (TIGR02594 family)
MPEPMAKAFAAALALASATAGIITTLAPPRLPPQPMPDLSDIAEPAQLDPLDFAAEQMAALSSPMPPHAAPPPRETAPRAAADLILAEAMRHVGKSAHQLGVRADLWCAAAVNKFLRNTGLRGTGSDLASSFARWGKSSRPKPGVIAVKHRQGGGHVVIVARVHGNKLVAISPNAGGRVRKLVYPVNAFYAFREPAI